MNKIINIKLKYLLVFAVVFLLLVIATCSKTKVDKIETTTKTTITKIKVKDRAKANVSTLKPIKTITFYEDTITGIARPKPTKKSPQFSSKNNAIIPFKKTPEKNREPKQKVKSVSDSLIKKPTEKEVEAKVFEKVFNLKNGIATVQVTAPCSIYTINLNLETENTIITTETKEKATKFIAENVWFLSVQPKYVLFPTPTFTGVELEIDYTIKNKIRLGVGVEYNNLLPVNNQIIIGPKIGIRL